ncbi:MAG: M15 family metallopeptidase [Clostridia bacterium]|nr:M15 family metallopeptidase [Clostridia bacterium]
MSTLIQSLSALAAAGALMFSAPLDAAAPQHDVDGELFLINRQWRVSEYYVPQVRVAKVSGQVRNMRPDAAAALEEMFAACKAETGASMVSVSGYRSWGKQNLLYSRKVKRTGSKEKADEYVARPGASEHQLGLAMDLGQKSKSNLTASFGRTKAGRWAAENSWRFGFILRYQEGWEDVTGYEFEPWHVRYVGRENAEKIYQADLPLETYLQKIRGETLLSIVTGEIIED